MSRHSSSSSTAGSIPSQQGAATVGKLQKSAALNNFLAAISTQSDNGKKGVKSATSEPDKVSSKVMRFVTADKKEVKKEKKLLTASADPVVKVTENYTQLLGCIGMMYCLV